MINQSLIESFCEGLKPPPVRNVWQWADTFRYLDETSAEPGLWRTARVPYLKKIMECLSENHPCRKVIFQKSAQVGGTECGLNFLAYIMHESPSSTMYVFPSTGEAEKFSKDRIDRMIDACPVLQDVKTKRKGKAESNTILRKEFKGGFLNLVGAQTAKALRSTAIKWLLMTEVDAYPNDVDKEGSPVKLAEKRTNTFSRSKVYLESTPTIDKFSKINEEFKKTNQQYYNVPCPHCGHMQKLVWPQLKFGYHLNENNKKIPLENSIFYECINCKQAIRENHKTDMLEAGEWIAEKHDAPEDIQGFHINALYAPLGWKATWLLLVTEFLEADEDRLKYKTFVNTILGETYKENVIQPDWTAIKSRAEPIKRGYVQDKCVALYASIDVQNNRLAVQIVGFGENMEMWNVDYEEFPGDPIEEEVWDRVDNFIQKDYLYENNENVFLRVKKCAVDTGYLADYCYDFVRRNTNLYYAIKGDKTDKGAYVRLGNDVDRGVSGKAWHDSIKLYLLNTQQAKKTIYSMLRNTVEGAKYIHFSKSLGDEYFQMLTSEVLITKVKNGEYVQIFEKPTESTRNEALDTIVYPYCLARMDKIDDLTGNAYKAYREKIFKTNVYNKENKREEVLQVNNRDYTTQIIDEIKNVLPNLEQPKKKKLNFVKKKLF